MSQSNSEASGRAGSKGVGFPTTSAVVRYQVTNVERSLAFYTDHLGFKLGPTSRTPMIAPVVRGDLVLLLSAPESSGSRPLADGRHQEPGGWNRIVLYVENLSAVITTLRGVGVQFRNEVVVGPGGSQIQLDDPDGNPIELHESPAGSQ